jgi:hypothetical protein
VDFLTFGEREKGGADKNGRKCHVEALFEVKLLIYNIILTVHEK